MNYEKPEKIDDETLREAAVEFLRNSLGGPGSDVSAVRLRNLEAYNAEPVGEFAPPEIMDRSDFVATDVSDTVDGILPQILKMFVAGSNAVECEPKNKGGEQAAKDATAYLNHVFYTRNDGLEILYDWFHDALLQKVGYVQVWAEVEKEDSRQRFEGVTEETIAIMLQDGGEIAGPPEVDERGLLSVTIAKQQERVSYKVAAIPPHEMRVDQNARFGEHPRAIGRQYFRTKQDLYEDGIDCSEAPASINYDSLSEKLEMLGDSSEYKESDVHESHKLYEWADVYLKIDRDGDGVAEWVRIGILGNEIATRNGQLDIEQVDDHPYCDVCPKPRPHAYFGDCPADRAYEPQRQRTFLMRSLLDNAALTVNGRTYVNTNAGVNVDDLLDNRPGGIVRGERSPGEAISPMVTPNLSAPVWQLNEWMQSWSETRTQFNRYSAGTDSNALNKTKGGIEILTQKADMGIELMARFFAQGVRKMFAKLLKLVTQYQQQEEWFAVNGTWVNVSPTEWRDQFNLRINVGLGQGTKEQLSMRIMGMLPLQQWGQQAGVVRPEHVAATIRTYAEANDFKDPDKFADEAPTGMPTNPQQFQQMQMQMQQGMEQMQAEMQKMQQALQQAEQEKAQLEQQLQSKEMDVLIKAKEFEFKDRELTHKESMDVRKMGLDESAPDRVVADAEKVGIESFAQMTEVVAMAAAQMADAAQTIAAAQTAPRVMQVVGPGGQVYTGQSGVIDA